MKSLALAPLALAGILIAGSAFAADNMIRPTCWEENVNGVAQRHCEVIRDQAAPPAHTAAPQQQAYEPPPQNYGPPQGYFRPPVRSWPTQACAYGPPPCPVYYDRRPAPLYGPMYAPPLAVFGFGPFTFVIP